MYLVFLGRPAKDAARTAWNEVGRFFELGRCCARATASIAAKDWLQISWEYFLGYPHTRNRDGRALRASYRSASVGAAGLLLRTRRKLRLSGFRFWSHGAGPRRAVRLCESALCHPALRRSC